jgi:hypothetical protein
LHLGYCWQLAASDWTGCVTQQDHWEYLDEIVLEQERLQG